MQVDYEKRIQWYIKDKELIIRERNMSKSSEVCYLVNECIFYGEWD